MPGEVAIVEVGRHAACHTPQILDQCEPQHDGNRPKFTEREWRNGLVCRDEASEAFGIYAAVAVRNRLQRNAIYAATRSTAPLRDAAIRGYHPSEDAAARCDSAQESGS